MKTFIDLGVWNGVSTRLFFEDKLTIKSDGFIAIGFDPIKTYLEDMKELEGMYPFKFINKAVWTYNGMVEFGEFPAVESSSIKKEKEGFDRASVSKVPCVDFSKWISKLQAEEIVVKMNIEGAEVDILEKMVKDDTLKLIDYLFIETHKDKLDEDHDKRMEKIKGKLGKWEEYVRPPLGYKMKER
jgi:FkbM family methyltransferase